MTILMFSSVAGNSCSANSVRVEVDPGIRYQEFQGFGTAIGWWGNVVGGWDEPARSDIVKLVFDKEQGLGFTVAKYYIGGGENPNCSANAEGRSHFAYSREMEGFKPTEDGPYDWTREKNQRWVLQHAVKKYGIEHIEANSLTAPWWMTVSGCASGADSRSTPNLKDDYYDDYAMYLTEIVKRFRDHWGIEFRTISPFAEASQSFWRKGHNQEGCFHTDEQANRLIKILGEKLQEEGLSTRICAPDEFSVGKSVEVYNTFDNTAKSYIAAISSHSYWGSLADRYAFRDLALSEGKTAVMSETCERGGHVHDHKSMAAALEMAWHITTDVRDMGSHVWLWFEPVTDERLAITYPSNWGAIHASYQGSEAQQYWITKTFPGIAQYSRLIGPGDIIIHNTDPYVLSAYNPSTEKLVLAVYNAEKSDADYAFDLSKFTGLKTNKVTGYRTSADQDMKLLPSIDIDNAGFLDRIPAESITTYLVDGARYSGPLHKNINDNVRGTGQDQIEYSKSWNYSSEKTQVAEWCHVLEARDYYKGYGEGLYGKDCHWSETVGDYFQIRFNGRQTRVYGSTDTNHGGMTIRLDDGEEAVVDCYSKSKEYQVLLYTSAVLPEGQHILKVQVAEKKNKVSTGHVVSVDKIQITGGTWRR